MSVWYEFKPVDTLFFKGAETFDKGSDHVSSAVFPPAPETLKGAIRTTYLVQNGISFKAYNADEFDDETVITAIGKHDGEPSWNIIGPLIKKREKIYVPAPYSWFVDKKEFNKCNKKEFTIQKAKNIKNSLIEREKNVLWVKTSNSELENAGGNWVSLKTFYESEKELLKPYEVYEIEPRTGIGLCKESGTVIEGHLYSAKHIRLLQDVSLVFGITIDNNFLEDGIMHLGGERKFGTIHTIQVDIDKYFNNGNQYVALTPINTKQIDKKLQDDIIATGRINYFGGWSLAKGFHKPLAGYYPAGTVLKKKIASNLLPMEEEKDVK
jgi:CRISPR-associated protein Cmr3